MMPVVSEREGDGEFLFKFTLLEQIKQLKKIHIIQTNTFGENHDTEIFLATGLWVTFTSNTLSIFRKQKSPNCATESASWRHTGPL